MIKKVNELVEQQLLQIYEKEQENLKLEQEKEDNACGQTSPRACCYLQVSKNFDKESNVLIIL